MRKINTKHFQLATRTTARQINQQIVLNLIREHQPLSRADLARRMQVSRGTITYLVDELIAEGVVYEGGTAPAPQGRKPTMLHVSTANQTMVAVDVRFSRTSVMLSDFDGQQIAFETFDTPLCADELVQELARRIERLLGEHQVRHTCEGIGLVVPGMVDRNTGVVLNSPQLGWRNVPVREALAYATGLRVFLENGPIALALAHMWLNPAGADGVDNFVYVSVSDGVGAGVIVNGEVLRGHGDTAGEFGHIPLNVEGPLCVCGLRGCWEAYTSNLATLARYYGLDFSNPENRKAIRDSGFTLRDLIARARSGDEKAQATLHETGRYLGIGMAVIISAMSPSRIIIGGEITAAWDMIKGIIRSAAKERALTDAAAAVPIVRAPAVNSPRLRGATALLVARNFAAPRVA